MQNHSENIKAEKWLSINRSFNPFHGFDRRFNIKSKSANLSNNHPLFRQEAPVDRAAVAGEKGEAEWFTAELDNMDRELEKVIVSSQKDFLSLGEKLQGFSNQSKHIASMYLMVAGLFSGKKMSEGIDSLNELLERISLYLGYCNGDLEQNIIILKNMLSFTSAIHGPMEDFRKIVKKLCMLAISTRIETSVLGQSGQFINVAEDVSNLSNMIETKAKHILGRSYLLTTMITNRLQEIFKLQDEHFSYANRILTDLETCLDSLSVKNNQSAVVANDIHCQSAASSDRIGELVLAMQFHDITSQRIEHVRKAVQDLARSFEQPTTDPLYTASNDLHEKANDVFSVMDLQSLQLTETRDEVLEAVESILANLGGISLNVDEMAHKTRDLVNITNTQSLSFLQEIEDGIQRVVDTLKKNSLSTDRISDAIHSVMSMVEEMGQFVSDIDSIGSEIELVALNGQVTASRLGDEGAALGVIADAIQKISQDARMQIRAVSDSVKGIVDCGSKLRLGIDESDVKHVSIMINDMTSDLEGLLGTFREAILEVVSKLESANRIAEPFARSLLHEQQQVTVQTVFSEGIGLFLESARKIMTRVLEYISSDRRPDGLSGIDSLKSRYTMHHERRVHQAYLEANGVHADWKKSETVSSGDLGANIELF